MSSTHWTEGAYDTSTRGTAQQRPIPVKRPARLTWSKDSGLAHEKPVNGLFANSPFYGSVTHGPSGPTRNRPNNVMWAVEYNASPFHFRPMYGPRRLSAHMRPFVTLGPLTTHGETSP